MESTKLSWRELTNYANVLRKKLDRTLNNRVSIFTRKIWSQTNIKNRRLLRVATYISITFLVFFLFSHNFKTSQQNNNFSSASKRVDLSEKDKRLPESYSSDLNDDHLDIDTEGQVEITAEDVAVKKTDRLQKRKTNIGFHVNKHVNFRDFKMIINNEGLCKSSKKVSLLIAVSSATDHFSARKAIRMTWGSQTALATHGVKLVFLLGLPKQGSASTVQKQIEEEAGSFYDIIQSDFVDTYLNLTLKSVTGLRWSSEYCSRAKYFMKTDDDIFINVPKLLAHLESETKKHTSYITGCIKQKKSFAPVNLPPGLPELPPAHPLFVAGAGYVITGNLVRKLYDASDKITLVPVEDVYVTGHLARAIGAHPPTDHLGFTCGELLVDDCDAMQMFTGHKITPERMQRIWEKINPPDYSTSPCFDF